MAAPMQVGPLSVAPAPSAPAHAGAATPPGGDHPFAKLLSAHKAAPKADADKNGKAAKASTGADAAKNAPQETRSADAAPVDDPLASTKHTQDAKDAAAPDAAAATTMDPALADWLTSLPRPVEAARVDPTADATVDAAGTARPKVESVAVAGVAPAEAAAANDPLAAAAPQPAAAAEPAESRPSHGVEHAPRTIEPAEHAALPQRPDAELVAAIKQHDDAARPAERTHAVDAPASPNALAALAAAPRSEHSASAPLHVDVATPVDAPEFRSTLGVQVSVLARDGVQHAQLNLNPAEMGPISVQIALDGTQAQVDFGADSATTRQIIESGLPELAAALRDAGLTLSGGGVSQHSRGHARGEANEPGRPGSTRANGKTAEADAVTVRRTGWRVPQGAVDTYA